MAQKADNIISFAYEKLVTYRSKDEEEPIPFLHIPPEDTSISGENVMQFWRRKGSALSLLPNDKISLLESNFTLRNRSDVISILKRFTFLADIILESVQWIQRQFQDTSLALDYHKDPENGSEHLIVYIATGLPAEAALEKLYAFQDNWWLMKSPRANGCLGFDVELR